MNSVVRRIGFTILLLIPACWLSAAQLRISHINVGQGDCTLIVSPTGKTMLIDAGNPHKGDDYVLPYLKSNGIKRLDYVVASHYHADHIGGLDEVINDFKNVGTVLDRARAPKPSGGVDSEYGDYNKAVKKYGHRRSPVVGTRVNLGGGVYLKCLANCGKVAGYGKVDDATKSENDLSLAWLLSYKNFRYFTGGDCSGDWEDKSTKYADLETPMAPAVGLVDAMKVNHHASTYSTSPGFVDALNPTAAIVHVGNRNNDYGHPTQKALDRLKDHAVVYLTEKGKGGTLATGKGHVANGNITIMTDGEKTFDVLFAGERHPYTIYRQ